MDNIGSEFARFDIVTFRSERVPIKILTEKLTPNLNAFIQEKWHSTRKMLPNIRSFKPVKLVTENRRNMA
jgi:hypothetical protein